MQVDQIEAAVSQQVPAILQQGWTIEHFEGWFYAQFSFSPFDAVGLLIDLRRNHGLPKVTAAR